MDRLEFQKEQVRKTTGIVLNIACKEDPAYLKSSFGDRIINCDISETDTDYGTPLNLDVIMDCRETWPFEDDYAELVIMAEILEHLYVNEAVKALDEARRVGYKLAITLPYDFTLPLDYKGPGITEYESGARSHVTGWDTITLYKALMATSWKPIEWLTVDYGQMGSERLDGYLIYCERI
jgi:hypothetical protein